MKYIKSELNKYYQNLKSIMDASFIDNLNNRRRAHSKILHKLIEDAVNGKDEIWIRFDSETPFDRFDNDESDKNYQKETNAYKDHQEITSTEPQIPIHFSLLTKRMREYDNLTFHSIRSIMETIDGNEEISRFDILMENISYRPFFFEFITEEAEFIKFFNRYVKQRHRDEESSSEDDSIWYRTFFNNNSTSDNFIEHEVTPTLSGAIEYSGSPFELVGGSLCFEIDDDKALIKVSKEEVAEIESTYMLPNYLIYRNQNINNMVFETLGTPDINSCDVYSIGTANCIVLHGEDVTDKSKKEIIYDIGFRNSKTANKDYACFIDESKKFSPDLVILSHWDSDHIFGCAYASRRIFACPWIAPNYLTANVDIKGGAKRLSCYLTCINKLVLSQNTNKKIAQTKGKKTLLEIWHSHSVSDSGIKKNNTNGLILLIKHQTNGTKVKSLKRLFSLSEHDGPFLSQYEIKNKLYPFFKQGIVVYLETITILLTGDVPYSSFPTSQDFDVWNLRYLLIPHHCSRMNYEWLDKNIENYNYGKKCAISCTKLDYSDYCDIKKNALTPEYKPPNCKINSSAPVKTDPEHIKILEKLKFNIFPTGQVSEKITIDFSNNCIILNGRKARKRNRGVGYFNDH